MKIKEKSLVFPKFQFRTKELKTWNFSTNLFRRMVNVSGWQEKKPCGKTENPRKLSEKSRFGRRSAAKKYVVLGKKVKSETSIPNLKGSKIKFRKNLTRKPWKKRKKVEKMQFFDQKIHKNRWFFRDFFYFSEKKFFAKIMLVGTSK